MKIYFEDETELQRFAGMISKGQACPADFHLSDTIALCEMTGQCKKCWETALRKCNTE